MIQMLHELLQNPEKQGNYPILFFLNEHDNNSEIRQLNQNCNHSQEYGSKNTKKKHWQKDFSIWPRRSNRKSYLLCGFEYIKKQNREQLNKGRKENAIIYCYKVLQFSLVPQSCPTLCDPMNHSTPGLPVHHQLPEFIQTQVHRVSDAIQPSHPLSSPPPPAPNPSQHQGLFQWVNSSHEVANVLEFQL